MRTTGSVPEGRIRIHEPSSKISCKPSVRSVFATLCPANSLKFSFRRLGSLAWASVGEMQIFAHRPEFAAHPAEEIAQLIGERGLARRDHFGHQQAGKDAVLFRKVAADGHAGAFFAAERDLVFAQQRANILEADRSFVNLHAVQACATASSRCVVATLRWTPRAFHRAFRADSRRPDRECDSAARNVPSRSTNAEAVGIAVGGKSGERFLFGHRFLQRREIFLRRVGAGAVEEHVAPGANRFVPAMP